MIRFATITLWRLDADGRVPSTASSRARCSALAVHCRHGTAKPNKIERFQVLNGPVSAAQHCASAPCRAAHGMTVVPCFQRRRIAHRIHIISKFRECRKLNRTAVSGAPHRRRPPTTPTESWPRRWPPTTSLIKMSVGSKIPSVPKHSEIMRGEQGTIPSQLKLERSRVALRLPGKAGENLRASNTFTGPGPPTVPLMIRKPGGIRGAERGKRRWFCDPATRDGNLLTSRCELVGGSDRALRCVYFTLEAL